MSACLEYGKCNICGKNDTLQRKYYKYDIKCECHSPYHFEVVQYCKNCEPKEPVETRITIKTKDLKRID